MSRTSCKPRLLEFKLLALLLLLLPLSCAHLRGLHANDENKDCSHPQAPYLYMTFHSGGHIRKYSRDGCLLDEDVVSFSFQNEDNEFRSLVVGPYDEFPNALYVANGRRREPQLLVFGECSKDTGKRTLVDVLTARGVSKDVEREFPNLVLNRYALHAYGIALDLSEYNPGLLTPEGKNSIKYHGPVYSTYQHSDVCLRFGGSGLHFPMNLPPSLKMPVGNSMLTTPYANGTFHQFGVLGNHPGGQRKASEEEQGVRAVAVVDNTVWIANENFQGVIVADKHTGIVLQFIPVINPIGMFHYNAGPQADGLVYISSKKSAGRGNVFAYSPSTYTVVKTYRMEGMSHPTGITVWDGVMYVIEQVWVNVMKFDLKTGKGELLIDKKDMASRPEQIAITPC